MATFVDPVTVGTNEAGMVNVTGLHVILDVGLAWLPEAAGGADPTPS